MPHLSLEAFLTEFIIISLLIWNGYNPVFIQLRTTSETEIHFEMLYIVTLLCITLFKTVDIEMYVSMKCVLMTSIEMIS